MKGGHENVKHQRDSEKRENKTGTRIREQSRRKNMYTETGIYRYFISPAFSSYTNRFTPYNLKPKQAALYMAAGFKYC